jgi:hypothetical protein
VSMAQLPDRAMDSPSATAAIMEESPHPLPKRRRLSRKSKPLPGSPGAAVSPAPPAEAAPSGSSAGLSPAADSSELSESERSQFFNAWSY